jgi:1-acyl-sn-glycerol-3-phosphate acyltransferase
VTFGRSSRTCFQPRTIECRAFSGVLVYAYSLTPGFLMSSPIAGIDLTRYLSTGTASSCLLVLATTGLTTTTPATSSGCRAASQIARQAPIESPPTTTTSVLALSFSNSSSRAEYHSSKVVPFICSHVVPCPGRSGTDTAYPCSARYCPHGTIDAGEPVKPWLRRTPTRRPELSTTPSLKNGSAWGACATGASLRKLPTGLRRRCRPKGWAGSLHRFTGNLEGLGCGGRRRCGLFYWFLKWIAIGPLLRLVFRPQVEGAENVPTEGPAILASNHLSYADWLFMPLTLPRRVTFVAKAEYFNTPGIKGWFQKLFFSGAGQVPIDRSGASAAEGALSAAKRILDAGELFGIYPEGTRSHDGRLYRGKTGVARLALETGVPVIPVAVVGTDVVAPPGKKFGSFTRPVVHFGKPLDFERYEGLANDRYILRSVTDEIMYEIMRLSGQEYVDMYATRAKDETKKAEAAARAAQRAAAAAVEESNEDAPADDTDEGSAAGPATKAS